eukprot:gene13637-18299_t
MSYEIHREPLYRRYHTELISWGCFYTMFFWFVLIFLPLIISYNSSAFWLREQIAFEQPFLTYRYRTIAQLSGQKNGEPINLYYSTSNYLNNLHERSLRIPLVQSAEIDDNHDGYMDRMELTLQMPLNNQEYINSVQLLVYFDVRLDTPAKYLFDSIAYFTYESMNPIANIIVDGDINLRQTIPLLVKGGFKSPFSVEGDIIPAKSDTSAYDVSISKILERNNARNLSMIYHTNFVNVQKTSSMPSSIQPVYPQYFNSSITIRVLKQPIRYTPTASEMLKFAWIQYISFFAIISFLIFRINSFVFRHQ